MTDNKTGGIQTPDPGPVKTLINVLFRPGRTFTALRDAKRSWWIFPALLSLLALGFHGYTLAQVSADALYAQQLQMMETLPADPRGGDFDGAPPTRMGTHPLTLGLTIGGRILGTIFTWLVWAGLLALASTFFGQNGAKFGGFFAMVTWARLPFALRSLVQAIYMMATGAVIYNQGLSGLVLDSSPTAMTSFSSGIVMNGMMGSPRYMPPTRSQQVLAALLGRVDIYLLWSLFLMVAGVWAFARLPRRKAILVTVGIWMLATLVGLLPTIIGLGQGARIF